MTIEKLFYELDLVLSDIVFAGLRNTQPVVLDKLATMQQGLKEFQMMEGYKLIGEFNEAITKCHTGNSDADESAGRLCALEFYVRSVLGNLS